MQVSGRRDGEPPTPEQIEEWQRLMQPPENELPAGVAVTAVLGRTADAAVGITQVEAFSGGFRFTLAVRLRTPVPDQPGGLFHLVNTHPHPASQVAVEERLLFGIEYADGRRASTLDHRDPFASRPLVLMQQGGGGGDTSVDQGYWVAPLPPDGPVTFVLAWPRFGIDETRTQVDGGLIRDAGARSEVLWPPPPRVEAGEPAPPPRPATGWFAQPPE